MTMPSNRMLQVTFLLFSIACSSSESFVAPRQSSKHVVSPSPAEIFQQQRQHHRRRSPLLSQHKTTKKRTTALKQSSIPYPADDSQVLPRRRNRVLQRIGQGLETLTSRPRRSIIPASPQTSTSTKNEGGSFLKRHPFLSAISITTINAVVADLMTQLVFQKSAAATVAWNAQRTLVFGAFGFFYQGMVQYVIVNEVWEKIFPGTSKRAVIAKICSMNLLSDPLFFMPTFYIFQQVMTGGAGMSFSSIPSIVTTALSSYKANCLIDWRNSWMVWFPGHAVTYGFMPTHMRIPWMAFLSFFYMCILSITRGAVGV